MIRTVTPAILAGALLVLPARSAAWDADSLRCFCADGALNHGGYVSCVAHMSKRLVASGDLDAEGRAEMVREAARSRYPQEPPGFDCTGGLGYGSAVQSDRQTYQVGDTARIEGMLWNGSGDDVWGWSGGSPDADEILFCLRITDSFGSLVYDYPCISLPLPTSVALESGRVRRFALDVDLVHRDSALGLPDGTPLEPGTYFVRVFSTAAFPYRQPPDLSTRPPPGLGFNDGVPIVVEDRP